MHKADKERVVEELTDRLRSSEALLVADYRGLTNSQLAGLRVKLTQHGARLSVVKNTLTRRAAEAAGSDALLALLEGPTAIAFVDRRRRPRRRREGAFRRGQGHEVLTLRGGVLSGNAITADEIERLAKLPPLDVLQAQLVGVIVAPLTQLAALLNAPLQNLVGLIDARIGQLEEDGDTSAADEPAGEPAAEPAAEAAVEEAPAAEGAADEAEAPEGAADAEAVSRGAGRGAGGRGACRRGNGRRNRHH